MSEGQASPTSSDDASAEAHDNDDRTEADKLACAKDLSILKSTFPKMQVESLQLIGNGYFSHVYKANCHPPKGPYSFALKVLRSGVDCANELKFLNLLKRCG
jgi:hypothetical protein